MGHTETEKRWTCGLVLTASRIHVRCADWGTKDLRLTEALQSWITSSACGAFLCAHNLIFKYSTYAVCIVTTPPNPAAAQLCPLLTLMTAPLRGGEDKTNRKHSSLWMMLGMSTLFQLSCLIPPFTLRVVPHVRWKILSCGSFCVINQECSSRKPSGVSLWADAQVWFHTLQSTAADLRWSRLIIAA